MKRISSILGILLIVLLVAATPVSAGKGVQGNQFVKQAGPELRLKGEIFRFAGTNNYYLMYKSPVMVDDVLETAAANGFRVLRMWGSLDIGNQDGSNSIHGKADGVYFQYWDGTAPAYNDGPDGLQRLDYVIFKAGQQGVRLVIPFVNNWSAFGGMDQYVRWRGGQYHDDFYTDAQIRQWFKAWIYHLLNRTNSYTGLKYKDDPTIMTWELANEPRCVGSGAYPRSSGCSTQTLIDWADDISTYVKTVDNKHLVSVGDEGFYCIPGASDWTENCNEGVDTIAFTRLENIDVMSFHLYPDHWGKDAAWSKAWIERHFADARMLDKPAMLGEFGWQGKNSRNPVFKEWTDTVFQSKGAGALYWILSGIQDDGSLYADYDGFTVYGHSPVFITLGNFAKDMNSRAQHTYPPVADHDSVVTEFETPALLIPAANDVAYLGAAVMPGSLDLDPAAEGQQTSLSVVGGAFALQPDGTVLFTPTAGFSGPVSASYTIHDNRGAVSNLANLVVTVKPSPTAALLIESFESGTGGWAAASWNDAGSTAQSAAFHTDGGFGLQITATNGGWFGVTFPAPLDLTGKVKVSYDLQTTGSGTSTEIALQFGDSWAWCEQGTWGWVNPGQAATVEIDLNNLGCASPDLSKLQAMYVWYSGGGTFYMDHVRAE